MRQKIMEEINQKIGMIHSYQDKKITHIYLSPEIYATLDSSTNQALPPTNYFYYCGIKFQQSPYLKLNRIILQEEI
jgi:hypothetical protein